MTTKIRHSKDNWIEELPKENGTYWVFDKETERIQIADVVWNEESKTFKITMQSWGTVETLEKSPFIVDKHVWLLVERPRPESRGWNEPFRVVPDGDDYYWARNKVTGEIFVVDAAYWGWMKDPVDINDFAIYRLRLHDSYVQDHISFMSEHAFLYIGKPEPPEFYEPEIDPEEQKRQEERTYAKWVEEFGKDFADDLVNLHRIPGRCFDWTG